MTVLETLYKNMYRRIRQCSCDGYTLYTHDNVYNCDGYTLYTHNTFYMLTWRNIVNVYTMIYGVIEDASTVKNS